MMISPLLVAPWLGLVPRRASRGLHALAVLRPGRCQLIEARQPSRSSSGLRDKATEFCWVGVGVTRRQQARVQGVAAERRTGLQELRVRCFAEDAYVTNRVLPCRLSPCQPRLLLPRAD